MGKDDFLAIRPQLPRLTKFSAPLSFISRPPILSYFVRFVPLVSLSPFAQNPSRASPPRLPPSLIFGSRIDVPRPQTHLPSSSLCPSRFFRAWTHLSTCTPIYISMKFSRLAFFVVCAGPASGFHVPAALSTQVRRVAVVQVAIKRWNKLRWKDYGMVVSLCHHSEPFRCFAA